MPYEVTWQDYFAATDREGRDRLTQAAQWAIESLDQDLAAPRSSVAPLALLDLAHEMEICREDGESLVDLSLIHI